MLSSHTLSKLGNLNSKSRQEPTELNLLENKVPQLLERAL